MAKHLDPSATTTTGTGTGSTTIGDSRFRRDDAEARERFGGLNAGAAFFGWLVAIAVIVLLASIIGAVVAGVGSTTSVTQSDAQRSAGTIGVTAAIVLLVVFVIAHYAGGYVAGRMSRFSGARQGFGVWLVGLVLTLIVIAVGSVFGSQYNVYDRVDLPRIPISYDTVGVGGVITAVALIVLSLIAAMLGGVVGHRYHDKVDRAAHIGSI